MKNYLILALLAAIFYGNTVFNGFIHDDAWVIKDNPYLKSWQYLPKAFTGCLDEHLIESCSKKGFYWRPTLALSQLITYQISPEPWFFHLMSIIYIWAAACLVLWFLNMLFKKSSLPLIGAAIFLTHPINSEAVNWVGASGEIFLLIFSMLMIGSYVRGFLIASAIFYLLALLSKETAAPLILLPVIYEVSFRKTQKNSENQRIRVSELFRKYLPYLIVLGVYLFARISVIGRVVYKYEGYYELSILSQIVNALALYPKYIYKLFYPLPLNTFHQFTPLAAWDWQAGVGALAVLLSLVLVFVAYRKKLNIILFGFGLFVLSILPVLIFINKLGEYVFSERYLLLPSVGFVIILLGLFQCHSERSEESSTSRRKIAASVVSLPPRNDGLFLLVLFGLYLVVSWWVVFNRNKTWKDDSTADKSSAQLLKFLTTNTYQSGDLSFNYPKEWQLTEQEGLIKIKGPDNFTLEMRLEKGLKLSIENYAAKQKKTYGEIFNQGFAKVPIVETAYARMWKNEKLVTYQFFLLKGSSVLELVVYPADSSLMKQFEEIVKSMKIQ